MGRTDRARRAPGNVVVHTLCALALALSLPLLADLGMGREAHAQTDVTLVKPVGRVEGCELRVGDETSFDRTGKFKAAQGFTTGSESRGYRVSELKMMHNEGSNNSKLKASVHHAAGTNPGDRLFAFRMAPPVGIRKVSTFVAPQDAPKLSPDTAYFIVMEETASGFEFSCWNHTVSDSEIGSSGWTIADTSLSKEGGARGQETLKYYGSSCAVTCSSPPPPPTPR